MLSHCLRRLRWLCQSPTVRLSDRLCVTHFVWQPMKATAKCSQHLFRAFVVVCVALLFLLAHAQFIVAVDLFVGILMFFSFYCFDCRRSELELYVVGFNLDANCLAETRRGRRRPRRRRRDTVSDSGTEKSRRVAQFS